MDHTDVPWETGVKMRVTKRYQYVRRMCVGVCV